MKAGKILHLSVSPYHLSRGSISGHEPVQNMGCFFFRARSVGEQQGNRDFHWDYSYCISLTFTEARLSFQKTNKQTVFSQNLLSTICKWSVLLCYSFPCTKQVSKTKQNENLIKMLLRAGVDVNAADFVSGFIPMPLWFACVQLCQNQTLKPSTGNIVLLSEQDWTLQWLWYIRRIQCFPLMLRQSFCD